MFLKFTQIWMKNPWVVGNLWPHVAARYGSTTDVFSQSWSLTSLEDFCGLSFLKSCQSFRNPKEETVGIVGLVTILVHYDIGCSNRTLPRYLLNVSFVCWILFSKFGADFFDFKCLWVCKNEFKLLLFSREHHFFHCSIGGTISAPFIFLGF